MYMNREFDLIIGKSFIQINITSAHNHILTIEHCIQVLHERFRMEHSQLLYKLISQIIIKELVKLCNI